MANNYYNQIVRLNVSQTIAPEPNKLQQTAAVVSMGGTEVPTGFTQYIASPSDLDLYITPDYDISSISWTAGVVSVTTTNNHGIPIGQTTTVEVKGMTPTGYNGTFTATSYNDNTLNYSLSDDPGASSVLGSLLIGNQIYIKAFDQTWWAQGNTQVGYYIYETNTVVPADVYAFVEVYLDQNPETIYNWCFLTGMDEDAAEGYTFLLGHNSLTALLKFYMPVRSSTYQSWAGYDTLRNTFLMIQSPDADPATELDVASFFQYITAFDPTPTNKLPPSQYTFLDGVTAYKPLSQQQINLFVDGNINFVTTGAEGGITNTILVPGKNLDGTPSNVAFSIDWIQIHLNQDIANAVINGSNNPLSPLYYNQDGINFLQQVAVNTANRAISTGLALGQVIVTALDPNVFATNVSTGKYRGNFVINAVPFSLYTGQNPSDYANGLYGGLQAAYVPQYGFEQIVFNLNVTQFA
jgi:hypothetical protein